MQSFISVCGFIFKKDLVKMIVPFQFKEGNWCIVVELVTMKRKEYDVEFIGDYATEYQVRIAIDKIDLS